MNSRKTEKDAAGSGNKSWEKKPRVYDRIIKIRTSEKKRMVSF